MAQMAWLAAAAAPAVALELLLAVEWRALALRYRLQCHLRNHHWLLELQLMLALVWQRPQFQTSSRSHPAVESALASGRCTPLGALALAEPLCCPVGATQQP